MLCIGGSLIPFGWSFLSIAKVPMTWNSGDVWTCEVRPGTDNTVSVYACSPCMPSPVQVRGMSYSHMQAGRHPSSCSQHTHSCTQTRLRANTHLRMSVAMQKCVHIHTRMRTHACPHLYTDTDTLACFHVFTRMQVHPHTYTNARMHTITQLRTITHA